MMRFASIVLAAATFLCGSAALAADQLTRFDFEDGTLQGWTIVSGEAGKLPTGPETARSGENFGQNGKYFIGLYENPNYDGAQIVLQSPVLTIKANIIALLVGGGSHGDSCYIALYKASDNSEVFRETGHNGELMDPRFWDVGKLRGESVYLRIVDSNTGGWGHINVDDIHEMTAAEERARAEEAARRAKRYDKWLTTVDAPAKKIVYTGKALGDIAMPLGGIGGGHVSICGDGAVRQWDIFNKVNEGCVIPDSFFAIWAEPEHGEPVARLLQQTSVNGLPAMEKAEFVGEYPVAELKFTDRKLPVQVSLRAFSPQIPMNAKDSGIPTAIFEYTVRNNSTAPVRMSLLSTLQNAAGYDGRSKIVDRVWNEAYGGNVNSVLTSGDLHGALLANPTLKADDRQFGTMVNATLDPNAEVTPQWDDVATLWSDFSRFGTVTGKQGPSQKGRTWNSAVTVPATLEPGQSVTVTFIWTWHFPNLYVWWDNREGQPRIGRMYNNWFADAAKTAEYVAANYERLSGDTEKFRRTLYKSTLPYYMLDRISAQSSTLVSTVCMWIEDGSFVGFEGAGCCPMNCTHVWNYEQQLARLFPELERNMRRIDLEVQQLADGSICHRTRLPLNLPRENTPFIDGHLGTILKSYREYRISPDRQWLDKMWPRIKLAMQYALNEWDPNKDGVIVVPQWNTYDDTMYGPNTFIGTLYLAALRASEEMAKIEGDTDFAATVRKVYNSGSKRLDEACWNGEFYIQIEAKPTEAEVGDKKWLLEDWPAKVLQSPNRPYGKGCHADQLLGQWWATQLDLGYLLPKDRVNKTLDSIMKYNWVKDFGAVPQAPRPFAGNEDPGLYNCTWPNGGKPANEMLYSFEVWTGIEYEVAGLMMQEGRVHEANQIVKAASDRYNGVPRGPIQRNPWAEVECSNHYARAMASWAILTGAQGFSYCGPDKAIGFNPVVTPENHRSFFTGAEGWGLFSQTRRGKSQSNTLELSYGKLDVKTLTLHVPTGAKTATARLDKKFGDFTQRSEGDAVRIEFAQPVTLKAGDALAVSLVWS